MTFIVIQAIKGEYISISEPRVKEESVTTRETYATGSANVVYNKSQRI